jgi:hypothetical protein
VEIAPRGSRFARILVNSSAVKRIAIVCLMAGSVFAADDGWSKVIALRSGTEIRVLKRDAKQPVIARMDEANDERLVLVVKNEQTAIPKEDIERVDYRPAGGSRVKSESKVTTEVPGARRDVPAPKMSAGEPRSVSSGLRIGSRPDFETVYRRKPGAR